MMQRTSLIINQLRTKDFEDKSHQRKLSEATSSTKEIYAEAKGNGFDPKVMRQVLRLRKMNPADRAETEFLLESYKAALGME